MNFKKIIYLILSIFIFNCNNDLYAVQLNSLFSDHAVIQQLIKIPVWGTGRDGENITVKFAGQKKVTKVKNGIWTITLDPVKAGGPYTMVISGDNVVNIKNILVGEVWLCSGQSNMERQLGPRPPQPLIYNWEAEKAAANYPQIREYCVPESFSPKPLHDADGKWVVCSPETVKNFSAVGYFFARDLYRKMKVPVGIIVSAYGGTKAQSWASKASLLKNPEFTKIVHNYDKAISDPAIRNPPKYKIPGGLYNAMILPLLPYAIKGVCWYQGSANKKVYTQYAGLMTTLIKGWRKSFNKADLPFLIVQLTPYRTIPPEIREAQWEVTKGVKNTALIVTTDCGDSVHIHSPFKQPVGKRLAIAARALAYNQPIEYSGPQYNKMKVKGDKIVLSFTHAKSGLKAKGNVLTGFVIAGKDRFFVPAVAKIKGKKVIVISSAIKKPTAVRYGWANVPHVNLYNKNGLPAVPFRTDK